MRVLVQGPDSLALARGVLSRTLPSHRAEEVFGRSFPRLLRRSAVMAARLAAWMIFFILGGCEENLSAISTDSIAQTRWS